MAIDNLYRAVEELVAGGKGIISGITTGSGTKFYFTSVDEIRDGTLIFTVFPSNPSASANLYINDADETNPIALKIDNAAITATSIKAGAAVIIYRTGTNAIVLSPKSVYTKTDVGLPNVDNESKATMFTDPTFTGVPKADTAEAGTNTTQLATTAFVKAADDALKVDTGLTGVPTAPTAPTGTNTTQLATTAFVENAIDDRIITALVTLDGDWTAAGEEFTYTLTNSDVKTTSLILSTAADNATSVQIIEYADKNLRCTAQAAGSLTFTCKEATAVIKTTPIRLIIIEPK